MDPIATAHYGMLAASRRFEQSAQRVAAQGTDADLASEVVEQIGAKHQFSANLLTWSAAEEMQGDLLDLLR